MRHAADYVARLRDGRAIFLDGKRVDDVTTHPAFAESIRRVAERYDTARNASDVTTCTDPENALIWFERRRTLCQRFEDLQRVGPRRSGGDGKPRP